MYGLGLRVEGGGGNWKRRMKKNGKIRHLMTTMMTMMSVIRTHNLHPIYVDYKVLSADPSLPRIGIYHNL